VPEQMRRTTARVMPVNRDGQVLLLFGCDPLRPDLPYWFTIGGATEPGETLAEAGAREMLEETGIVVSPDDLVGPYHRGFHEFSWNGWDIANDSHFFAVRVDDVSVSFDGLEPMEVGNVLDSGWWSPDEMPDRLSNAELPKVARLAVEAVGL
jgi:8-oxo-dGTP pyrophosphatase MutT (NUDIX family)